MRLCIKALDNNMSLPKTTILEAMKILSSSWSELSVQAIRNCFRKAGISDSSQQQLAQCDADNPFKDLEVELDHLKEADPTAVQDDSSAENFI